MLIKPVKCLVVAAHSDDEALGCGGTIARHVGEGVEVSAVFMTDGVASRLSGSTGSIDEKERRASAYQASRVLGMNTPYFLNFPDNRMDSLALLDIVQELEPIIKKVSPTIIYTHHAGDLNVDHRIVHQAVMTICRPQPNFSVKEIYSFEVRSSTEWVSNSMGREFRPNCYVDISKYWDIKLKALQAYDDEMREFPHSRSYKAIEASANSRGSTVGVDYAEAFQLERMLVS